MKKIFLIINIFIFFASSLFSLNYITTAESVSWSGAYTSVADGFEAMLYNPAGLYFTNTKYGINIFGSYGARMYCNSISSADTIAMFKTIQSGKELNTSDILSKMLLYMPETGVDVGLNFSIVGTMTYLKFKNFSLGISVIEKTDITASADKALFQTFFEEQEDLTGTYSYNARGVFLQYIDFNFILSTRAKFLEKIIPVDKIFVGLSTHFYYPTLFMKINSKIELGPGDINFAEGCLDSIALTIEGDLIAAGNGGVIGILRNIPKINEIGSPILNYAATPAFGFGWDIGFLIKFNKFVRLGFAATDIGFIVFPQTAKTSLNIETEIDLDSVEAYPNTLINETLGAISDSKGVYGNTEWWMPNTALRLGVAVTPSKKGIFTWATDVALSDLNRLLIKGYPSFNFSTGIEFQPSYRWFAAPIRTAFSYNSQANAASLSFGIGLYFGPVEMEIGIKGIEFLIPVWGAKEVCVGVDLKFEF